jgi:hypothetical protein
MQTKIRMYGEVAGTIWMPVAECSKHFDVELVRIPRDSQTRVAHSHGWPMEITELRDALLTITNDGDFQSCGIVWATLEVSHMKGSKKITRYWDIRGEGYNADCMYKESN